MWPVSIQKRSIFGQLQTSTTVLSESYERHHCEMCKSARFDPKTKPNLTIFGQLQISTIVLSESLQPSEQKLEAQGDGRRHGWRFPNEI